MMELDWRRSVHPQHIGRLCLHHAQAINNQFTFFTKILSAQNLPLSFPSKTIRYMIPFKALKKGDYVYAAFEGSQTMGPITGVNNDEQQVCVLTGENEFWYPKDAISPIPINEATLAEFGFEQSTTDKGSHKFSKGPFRLVVRNEDFNNVEMWYREDIRRHPQLSFVHELQNHYLEMTKVHLEK
jgi:hypothetical protein